MQRDNIKHDYIRSNQLKLINLVENYAEAFKESKELIDRPMHPEERLESINNCTNNLGSLTAQIKKQINKLNLKFTQVEIKKLHSAFQKVDQNCTKFISGNFYNFCLQMKRQELIKQFKKNIDDFNKLGDEIHKSHIQDVEIDIVKILILAQKKIDFLKQSFIDIEKEIVGKLKNPLLNDEAKEVVKTLKEALLQVKLCNDNFKLYELNKNPQVLKEAYESFSNFKDKETLICEKIFSQQAEVFLKKPFSEESFNNEKLFTNSLNNYSVIYLEYLNNIAKVLGEIFPKNFKHFSEELMPIICNNITNLKNNINGLKNNIVASKLSEDKDLARKFIGIVHHVKVLDTKYKKLINLNTKDKKSFISVKFVDYLNDEESKSLFSEERHKSLDKKILNSFTKFIQDIKETFFSEDSFIKPRFETLYEEFSHEKCLESINNLYEEDARESKLLDNLALEININQEDILVKHNIDAEDNFAKIFGLNEGDLFR